MERCKVLEELRKSNKFPPGFEEKNPYQAKLITSMLQHSPKLRPTAIELLRVLPGT
jgi:hypothetical protein